MPNTFREQKFTGFLDYHQRDSDRVAPRSPATFDDISAVGETKVQDMSLELGRSFAGGPRELEGGRLLPPAELPG